MLFLLCLCGGFLFPAGKERNHAGNHAEARAEAAGGADDDEIHQPQRIAQDEEDAGFGFAAAEYEEHIHAGRDDGQQFQHVPPVEARHVTFAGKQAVETQRQIEHGKEYLFKLGVGIVNVTDLFSILSKMKKH